MDLFVPLSKSNTQMNLLKNNDAVECTSVEQQKRILAILKKAGIPIYHETDRGNPFEDGYPNLCWDGPCLYVVGLMHDPPHPSYQWLSEGEFIAKAMGIEVEVDPVIRIGDHVVEFLKDAIASPEVPRLSALEDRVSWLELFRRGSPLSAREMVLELGEAKTRLSKLEAAFNEHLVKEREAKNPTLYTKSDAGFITTFPDGIERHVGVVRRLQAVSSGNDHHLYIDPKSSPKDIPFEVALAFLKAGRRVRQAHWDDDTYITVEHGCIITSTAKCRAFESADDAMKAILATDWLVLPE